MLTTSLLTRSLAQTPPLTFARSQNSTLLRALQPAPDVRFDGEKNWIRGSGAAGRAVRGGRDDGQEEEDGDGTAGGERGEGEDGEGEEEEVQTVCAHRAGVNAIVIDKFEGRYLISGGADGAISMWDLEAAIEQRQRRGGVAATHVPIDSVARTSTTHTFGITGLSFYPFDSLAFLSSSYDHTLKLYSSTTLQPSASFDLSCVIYSHALSPIASHLLVACATQHPAVRLVDLRSGAATQSLAGHSGAAVLSVAWSPKDEYILASGGTDGTIRFWDVRKSAGMLGVLDMEDSVGLGGYNGLGLGARSRLRGHAHAAAVNGVVWLEDGRYVVSTGHDEKTRVWDVLAGANTLANFGPMVRNRALATLLPCVTPKGMVNTGEEMMFFPNEGEILMHDLFDGKLVKRLRALGSNQKMRSGAAAGVAKNRVTSLAWRHYNIELLSAHSDGTIRSWQPRTRIDALVDQEEESEEEDSETEAGSHKRKRQVLDDIYRDLTQQKVTFR